MSDEQIPDVFRKDDVARFCDVLEKLRKGSFENWVRRQTYEWKMCITIWTPLVAFLGILLTQRHVWFPWPPLVALLMLWAVIHVVWQRNLKQSNDVDVRKMHRYEDKRRALCNVHVSYNRDGFLVFPNWSHVLYVVITIGLIVAVLYANSFKRSGITVLPEDVQKLLDSKFGFDLVERDKWIGDVLHTQLAMPQTKATPTQGGNAATDPARRAANVSVDLPSAQTPDARIHTDLQKPPAPSGR